MVASQIASVVLEKVRGPLREVIPGHLRVDGAALEIDEVDMSLHGDFFVLVVGFGHGEGASGGVGALTGGTFLGTVLAGFRFGPEVVGPVNRC